MMLPTKAIPSMTVLRAYFDYIPSSGDLIWKKEPPVTKKMRGKIAGSVTGSRGYRAVALKGTMYQAHRLIWSWVTGDDPGDAVVDHINHDRTDNRWENLRLADWSKNTENLKNGRPSRRKLVEPNIYPTEYGFRVQIKRDGVRYRKHFQWLDDAVAWRDKITTHGGLSGPVCRDVRG